MKKLHLLAIALMVTCVAGAQSIENSSHSTTGYINSDGTIENSSHSTAGYITSSGEIENSSHSTIGYITIQRRD